MKARSIILSAIVVSLFLLQLTFAALPRYEIIDLGTLDGSYSNAQAINDAGQVVGISGGPDHAFLWDSSTGMIDLGTLPGQSHSGAEGINDRGQVVGDTIGDYEFVAFIWDSEKGMRYLDGIGTRESTAFDINNRGQVVGEVGYAFLWDPDNGVINLGTLGGTHSSARAINNMGQVVGGSSSSQGFHAFFWDSINGMRDLGTLGSGISVALGINNHGQVVGRSQYEHDNDNYHAFLWDNNNGMIDLSSSFAFGTEGSVASAINDAGQIVGFLNPWGPSVAFYLDIDNGMIKLEDLIPPGSMWKVLKFAFDINNRGQIVGQGITNNGKTLAFLMTPVPPKTIYVDDDAAGANNGLSWADAFNYLQDALTAAWSGDEILVAQGIYKPDQGAGITPGDREATFQLINGVTLKGGYAGAGTPDPNAWDIDENRTILSGDLAGDDGYNLANRKENSYHIVTGSGTDASAVLDGFNIRYGHANRQADPWGGGMYNDYGSPTVKNCVFASNYAFAEQGSMGGGMYNYYSSPILINCAFIGNHADVTDRNQAGGNGGGMYNNHSSPMLTNCTFRSNSVRDYGGGMYNIDSNPTLIYSTLQANSAFLYGGGMYNSRSTLTLTKCLFIGNWTYSDTGGTIYSDASDTTLTNCTLTRNGATNGSSLACDSPGQLHPSSVQMTNCIFWDHGNEIWNNDNSSVIISYSNVQCGWPGLGNIAADPLFVNPGGVENFRLAESSPCIDTGDPNYIPEPNESDFDGFPRIIGRRIDMGAYEFQGRLILYVDNDAPGSNDGSSWANAYNCLQDALFPADPTGGPVEIRVAQGIYKPDQGAAVTPGDRAASFWIKARVTVKGGYAGFGEPDPNARDIKIYETILTGDLIGDDGPNFENNEENSYNVVTGGASGETTILDGFTITGGNANGSNWGNKRGGGIRLYQDLDFTIKNCTIIRNRAEFYGGGIHSSGSSSCCFPITNCRFIANSADRTGGAISLDGESLPNISNCVFAGNSAVTGGAIGNIEGYPDIINCTFSDNTASDECGGVIDLDGISSFENCILWGNTDAGGADESAQVMLGWCWNPHINYSCIQGWTGALGGIGNINEDPLFVDPGYWDPEGVWIDGNYHLLSDSPCIDTGDPNYVAEPNETDLDGKPRVIGGRIDMGAYEAPIFAEARILPRTINLASKGKSITCYIRLPEGYNVADIDPNSILLERQIKAEQFSVDEHKQVATATFDREKVQSILNVGDIELSITCQLTDGTYFEATDVVKVTDKGGGKQAKRQ